jgi:hypothetical protein
LAKEENIAVLCEELEINLAKLYSISGATGYVQKNNLDCKYFRFVDWKRVEQPFEYVEKRV